MLVHSARPRCPEPPGAWPKSKDSARTVLRRAQPARRQRVQAGGSCPGGCSAPGTAALPSDCGSGFGRSQRPRECEGAKVAATEVHRSLTGHTCRTEKWSDTGWQGNIARMQGAGLGNSSAVIVPASKPANNAADGRKQENRSADGGHTALKCACPVGCTSSGQAASTGDF